VLQGPAFHRDLLLGIRTRKLEFDLCYQEMLNENNSNKYFNIDLFISNNSHKFTLKRGNLLVFY